jgi:hypothetical protein
MCVVFQGSFKQIKLMCGSTPLPYIYFRRSIDWVQLSRILPGEGESSISETTFLNEKKRMDYVKKVNNCINIPSS